MAERFVLDANVALAWFLRDTEAATRYAAAVRGLASQCDDLRALRRVGCQHPRSPVAVQARGRDQRGRRFMTGW